MSMKLLVLTSIYIGEDIPKEYTPVVHYFTREWVKMGHEVLVIHNLAYFPKFFYWITFFYSKLISSLTGTSIPKRRLTFEKEYVIDLVEVFRVPIFKLFPHKKFSKKSIDLQTNRIVKKLSEKQFKPDFIIGHWTNPQLELLHALKKIISDAKTAMVMHDDGLSLMKLYKLDSINLIDAIDVWGFRSLFIKNRFENFFGKRKNAFLCYSGIPENYTTGIIKKEFNEKLTTFLFVGTLIKRKYPSKIIDALNIVYKNKDFVLNYIGEGNELRKIKNKIDFFNCHNSIKINGFIPREQVREIMVATECFIMISKREAFGLVYLEAMAAGCLIIASREEGFDGVIINGFNGFLCEAGNEFELAEIIERINSLSLDEKICISNNAALTASRLTNYSVADFYLNNLKNN